MPPETADTRLRRFTEALGPGLVRTDEDVLRTYSTDASPCVVRPRAVAFPRDEADVVRVLRAAREVFLPTTPRAAGTSLSGAAIGPGVVLDTTGLGGIDIDATRGVARVGPGALLRELNEALASKGFRFPLEPGSLEWCRIGGMVGHNASGYRSVKYGQMGDFVLGLRVVLVDGTVVEASDVRVDGDGWRDLTARVPAMETIRRVVSDRRDAILGSRRPVRKHSAGYNVWSVAEGLALGVLPLAALFVGSEGTLGVVTEVTLRVLPIPRRSVTLLVLLDRFEDLGRLVADLLALGPSALEAVDGTSLDLLGRESFDVPPSAQAMLLIEFDEDADRKAAVVEGDVVPRYALSRPLEIAFESGRQAALWAARRSLFPALLKRPGRRRPWGFVEDAIVPVRHVPEFVAFLADLARRHDTVAGIYGHIGDGNTHYRPLFDPTDRADFERMRALRDEFHAALLERFEGVPSAEHGIGRLRGDVLDRTWGPSVVEAMRAIKSALDPDGLLNPGVLFPEAPWWETWAGLDTRTPM